MWQVSFYEDVETKEDSSVESSSWARRPERKNIVGAISRWNEIRPLFSSGKSNNS